MFAARVALWNKNKIVVLVATGMWLASLSFLIYGKSLMLTLYGIPSLLLHKVS
jgi:hypothetical protein